MLIKTDTYNNELSLVQQEVVTCSKLPDELTCGSHLVSLFQSDPRSLGELLWVHCETG